MPITTTVIVGDTINWQWTASASSYQFCINQTENITAKETKQDGFSSGPQTSSG
jgi:plastocyanin